MVQEIIVNSRIRSRVCTHVIVEVHVAPGYAMNWVMIGAQLWAEPPTHIQYVQPHVFLQPYYCTVECDYSEVTVIDVSLDNMTAIQWAADCVEHSSAYHISEPSKLHPPALSFDSFPQYPSRYHSFQPHQLLRPSISGSNSWDEVHISDEVIAMHAAIYMMSVYYRQGYFRPEEAEPYIPEEELV
jgi:hypothetical protein